MSVYYIIDRGRRLMNRKKVSGLLWGLTVVLAAGMSYWAGQEQLLLKKPVEVMHDVQIVEPLTPSQLQLFETGSIQISKGMIVTVSEPGKPPQRFIGQAMPIAESNSNIVSSDIMSSDIVNSGIIEAKLKLPKYYPKPCRVRDSKGRWVWGICLSCRLDK